MSRRRKTLPVHQSTAEYWLADEKQSANMNLADFKKRAFGEPHLITHNETALIIRTAGAVTQKGQDGRGLLDRIPLYAVSDAHTPAEFYVLSREELVTFLGENVAEKHFPGEI